MNRKNIFPIENSLKVWYVWVNGNWRITFRFENEDVYLVDYLDYH